MKTSTLTRRPMVFPRAFMKIANAHGVFPEVLARVALSDWAASNPKIVFRMSDKDSRRADRLAKTGGVPRVIKTQRRRMR